MAAPAPYAGEAYDEALSWGLPRNRTERALVGPPAARRRHKAADGVTAPALPGTPVSTLAGNRPDCLWAIYATRDERDAALDALLLTWAALEDRSVLLNYGLTWTDRHGFGVHVTTSEWPGRTGTVQ